MSTVRLTITCPAMGCSWSTLLAQDAWRRLHAHVQEQAAHDDAHHLVLELMNAS